MTGGALSGIETEVGTGGWKAELTAALLTDEAQESIKRGISDNNISPDMHAWDSVVELSETAL